MYTLGIDIGSTTSKSVILKDGSEIIAKSLKRGGMGTEGPAKALAVLFENSGLTMDDMDFTVVTGYGRKKFEGADKEVSELTCHALGGKFIYPELRTVIDIGGQDSKVISLTPDGKMANFVMNDKCAAGTGRFLDVMAQILQIDINDMGRYAADADEVVRISNTCTVFAESEVISQMAAGVRMENLIAGICESVGAKVSTLARRVGAKETVCLSGGVARNSAVRKSLEKNLGVTIQCSEDAQYFGALGAALYACKQVKEKDGGK